MNVVAADQIASTFDHHCQTWIVGRPIELALHMAGHGVHLVVA